MPTVVKSLPASAILILTGRFPFRDHLPNGTPGEGPRLNLTPCSGGTSSSGASLSVVLRQAHHVQAHLLGAQTHTEVVGKDPDAVVWVEVVQVSSAAQNR